MKLGAKAAKARAGERPVVIHFRMRAKSDVEQIARHAIAANLGETPDGMSGETVHASLVAAFMAGYALAADDFERACDRANQIVVHGPRGAHGVIEGPEQ